MWSVQQWRKSGILASVLLLVFVLCEVTCKEVILNHWMVEVDGGLNDAKEIAKRTGFSFVRHAPQHSPHSYLFTHPGVAHAMMKRSTHHSRILKAHPRVTRTFQLTGFPRAKRGYNPLRSVPISTILKEYPQYASQLEENDNSKIRIDPKDIPTDPLFIKEWYLRNVGQASGKQGLDLNVIAAWKLGYTGKGVTTAIMDDGIDYLHPDLADNYNAEASYDFSCNDPYPYPRYTDTWFNSHGTRCAGEIAAARDNGVCGVGVAYKSMVAGLRMLDQPFMTDLIEASAMGHKPNLIDIYSASWGPTDDGKTVDGPRNMTMEAIVNGVNEGRNGKGNIFVWASGDGGQEDDCNCDGYAASMWTISINSATNDGQTAGYDESCSSTLASTFSNGKSTLRDAGVATTDLYGNCTTTHSGTSAAAPEAAGVFALALEANRNLTWVDLQHLTVLTSKKNKLKDVNNKHNWQTNGADLEYNHLFGFGVMDAESMVNLSKVWVSTPERKHCSAGMVVGPATFSTGRSITVTITTNGCEGTPNHLKYLEHVQAFITITSTFRGNVAIYLTSAMGTRSMLLSQRPNDNDSKNGFTKWPFMTTHCWCEKAGGTWTLEMTMIPDGDSDQESVFHEWSLELHGTLEPPYEKQTADLGNHEKLDKVMRIHAGKTFTK